MELRQTGGGRSDIQLVTKLDWLQGPSSISGKYNLDPDNC